MMMHNITKVILNSNIWKRVKFWQLRDHKERDKTGRGRRKRYMTAGREREKEKRERKKREREIWISYWEYKYYLGTYPSNEIRGKQVKIISMQKACLDCPIYNLNKLPDYAQE